MNDKGTAPAGFANQPVASEYEEVIGYDPLHYRLETVRGIMRVMLNTGDKTIGTHWLDLFLWLMREPATHHAEIN